MYRLRKRKEQAMGKVNHKKSGYWTRIEKKLAELSIMHSPETLVRLRVDLNNGVSMQKTITGDDAWKFVGYRYGHKNCDLCGHVGIVRIFKIKSAESGEELEIGSECVRNYLHADLVDALCKEFDLEYHKIVNPEQYASELEVLRWATENGKGFSINSLNRVRSNLINYANPASVIQKIVGGKTVGKREKEVIAYWTLLKNNSNAKSFAIFCEYFYELAYEVQHALRKDRAAQAKQEQRQAFAIFNPATMLELVLVGADTKDTDASYYVNRIYKHLAEGEYLGYVREQYEYIRNRVLSKVYAFQEQEKKEEQINELVELFKSLYEKDLPESQKRFVDSVYSYYKRNKNVTPKQEVVLRKFL